MTEPATPTMPRREPDLVVAGAQKAATTMIAAVLGEHPDVEMVEGEIHDFADPLYTADTAASIAQRFSEASAMRRGFKCASYLGQPEVPARLVADLGLPDIVFAFRDPVRRAVSAWYWYMRQGLVPIVPLDAAFTLLLSDGVSGHDWRHGREILEWGLYASHVQRWLTYFPREKLHFVVDLNLRREPERTIAELYKSLGLDASFVPTAHLRRHNDGIYSYRRIRWLRSRLKWVWQHDADGVWRQRRPTQPLPALANAAVVGIDRLVLAPLDRTQSPALAPAVEHALREYYRGDTLALETMLGVDLSPWLAKSS